jgi:hypothetical protein
MLKIGAMLPGIKNARDRVMLRRDTAVQTRF